MTALLLLALAVADGGTPAPWHDGPLAPRLEHHVVGTSVSEPCTFEQRSFDDPRVRVQWLARCDQLRSPWLVFEGDVALAGLFAQFWTDTVLAFRPTSATAFSRQKPPSWVATAALNALEQLKGTNLVPGFVRLAVDPRDGAMLGHSFDRGYLRLGESGPEPLFAGPLPLDLNTPVRALVFDGDAGVKPPWLVYAPDPWRRVELRLRSPSGDDRLLFERPARSTGGSYRVDGVAAVRASSAALPVIVMQADGDTLLFTPRSDAVDAPYEARLLAAPRMGLPQDMPAGETGAPHPKGRACADTSRSEAAEAVFDPNLFEWKGRTFVVYLSELTRTGLHFGAVPRAGKTPAEDRLACEWIVDTRESDVALVVGEVTAAGVRERMRTSIEILPGRSFHGSTNSLARQGDQLAVTSSSNGLITFTLFDLTKLAGAER